MYLDLLQLVLGLGELCLDAPERRVVLVLAPLPLRKVRIVQVLGARHFATHQRLGGSQLGLERRHAGLGRRQRGRGLGQRGTVAVAAAAAGSGGVGRKRGRNLLTK